MDSSIVASLIAAAASILVALISKWGSPASAPEGTKTRVYAIPKRNRRICNLFWRVGFEVASSG